MYPVCYILLSTVIVDCCSREKSPRKLGQYWLLLYHVWKTLKLVCRALLLSFDTVSGL